MNATDGSEQHPFEAAMHASARHDATSPAADPALRDRTPVQALEAQNDARLVSGFSRADRDLATAYIARNAKRRTGRRAARKLTTTVGGHLRITEDPPRQVHLGPAEMSLVGEVSPAIGSRSPGSAFTCSTASEFGEACGTG